MPEETLDRSSLERLVLALRQARVQKSLSVDDISRLINIRETHIEKIEEGDFGFVPPLYVYSYLKKYASEVGVGDDALLQSCRSELGMSGSNFSIPPTAQVVTGSSRDSGSASQGKGRGRLIAAVTAAAILIVLALLYLYGRF